MSCVRFEEWQTLLLIVTFFRLIEKKIGGQLLILIASKVGLDDQIPLETQTAELESTLVMTAT